MECIHLDFSCIQLVYLLPVYFMSVYVCLSLVKDCHLHTSGLQSWPSVQLNESSSQMCLWRLVQRQQCTCASSSLTYICAPDTTQTLHSYTLFTQGFLHIDTNLHAPMHVDTHTETHAYRLSPGRWFQSRHGPDVLQRVGSTGSVSFLSCLSVWGDRCTVYFCWTTDSKKITLFLYRDASVTIPQ